MSTAPPEPLVAAPPPGPGLLAQVGPWLGHVGCFAGAALVGAGLVHHPPGAGRSTALTVVGALAFLVAALAGELLGGGDRPSRGQLLRAAGCALLLALGTGMLSGGVQHLRDVPDRAVVLVPAGLLLSWLALRLRAGTGLRALVLSRATGGVAVLSLGLFLALPLVAGDAPAGGHAQGGAAATAAVPSATTGTAPPDAAHTGAGGPAHTDTAHTDTAHTDTAHTDAAHTAPPGTATAPADAAELEAVLAELQERVAELGAE